MDNDDLSLRQFCPRKNLWMISGYWWFASKTILQARKVLNIFRILMICGQDNFAGEKLFEYYQDNGELRRRQFCRRKSLWILSGYWWFASKTILQVKKSLNIFRMMVICVVDNFAGEKVLEFFQDNADLRLWQFCQRKKLWMISRYWWFASKTILQARKILNIFKKMMICGQDNIAGEKVFENFQDNDDLRLRRFCRQTSLWMFSG